LKPVRKTGELFAQAPSTADVGHPFTEYGALNEGRAPKGTGNLWPTRCEVSDGLVFHKADGACVDGDETAVQRIQMNTVQIGDIACDLERNNLANTVTGRLILPAGQSIKDDATP
jgi:hypothetical protein